MYYNNLFYDSPIQMLPSSISSYDLAPRPIMQPGIMQSNFMRPGVVLDYDKYGNPNTYKGDIYYATPTSFGVIREGPLQIPYDLDLNNMPRIQEQYAKYFRYKILDYWLYNDMSNLLGYLKIVGDRVKIITNLSEYTDKKDSSENIEKKVSYIEDNILSVDSVRSLLKKFVKGTKYNWYELHKSTVEPMAAEYIKKQLETNLKNAISNVDQKV